MTPPMFSEGERLSEMDSLLHRFREALGCCEHGSDWLGKYRSWLDKNGIPAEVDGWPSPEAKDEANIAAFIAHRKQLYADDEAGTVAQSESAGEVESTSTTPNPVIAPSSEPPATPTSREELHAARDAYMDYEGNDAAEEARLYQKLTDVASRFSTAAPSEAAPPKEPHPWDDAPPADAELLRTLASWCHWYGEGIAYLAAPRLEKLASQLAAAPQDDPIEKMLDEFQRFVAIAESTRYTSERHDDAFGKRQNSRAAIRDYVSRLRAERDEARRQESVEFVETVNRLSSELSKMKETALTPEEAAAVYSAWFRSPDRYQPEGLVTSMLTKLRLRAAASPKGDGK